MGHMVVRGGNQLCFSLDNAYLYVYVQDSPAWHQLSAIYRLVSKLKGNGSWRNPLESDNPKECLGDMSFSKKIASNLFGPFQSFSYFFLQSLWYTESWPPNVPIVIPRANQYVTLLERDCVYVITLRILRLGD